MLFSGPLVSPLRESIAWLSTCQRGERSGEVWIPWPGLWKVRSLISMTGDMLGEERSPWGEVTLYSICPPSSARYKGLSSLVTFHTWLVLSALLMSVQPPTLSSPKIFHLFLYLYFQIPLKLSRVIWLALFSGIGYNISRLMKSPIFLSLFASWDDW